MPKVKLGDLVRDVVTGYEGIATARCTFLQGCDRICIQPPMNEKEHKHVEGRYYDEPDVVIVEKGAYFKRLEETKKKRNGNVKKDGGPHDYVDQGKPTP